MSAPPLSPIRRLAAVLAVAAAVLAAGAPAQAADLLVLDGEQQTIGGTQSYGIVYVDGELRLTGDTTIQAASVYVGPNAALRTCFVEGSGNGGCTAGRSLTIRSAGPLTLAPGLDLTAGSGTVRNAGALTLEGARVAVGGDITTSGSGGGASGAVTITSTGALSTGAITAYGAPVRLTAAGAIDTGDIQTQGSAATAAPDPARVQAGGPVSLASTGGDVRVSGSVSTWGRDAPGNAGAGLGGGAGADVSITGTDVRSGNIDATGGSSVDASAGPSGSITLAARGALHALGKLDVAGSGSTSGEARPGSAIRASAAGPLVVAGGAYAGGGSSPLGGAPGGEITLQGGTVDTGTLWAPGANAGNSATPRDGGAGGAISVTAAGRSSLAALQAFGGNAPAGATPGGGGRIAVTSTAGSIATGRVSTQGGWPNGGPGASGGPIRLSAHVDLTVADALSASGTNANGETAPPRAGGSAGAVLLRAATGALTLGDGARAEGGSGAPHPQDGALGGAGGAGGRVDVVTRTLGTTVAIFTHGGAGGDWGDDQGPGGSGGAIYAWTDAPLFDDQKVVDSDGGSGNPLGASGLRVPELSPGAPTIDAAGVLSFPSRSPDAEGYRILRSVGGAAPEVVLETTQTTGLRPPAPVCTPVAFTVAAQNSAVGWTSDPSPPVSWTRPASATQGCGDAPRLTARRKLRLRIAKLRRAGWKAVVPLRSSGIGSVRASLVREPRKGRKTAKRPLAIAQLALPKPGARKLAVRLPRTARQPGRFLLRLVATSPDGRGRATTTLKLEVTR
jgi:hypothetical protein